MTIPTIQTFRLTLRAFTEGDSEPLHHILSDGDVLQYYPNPDPPPRDRVRKFIANQLEHWKEHGFGWWAIEPHHGNELLGWSGLQYLPETKEVEVAYLLGKAHWGKGLATEAAKASLEYGFDQLGLECIVGIVHPDNVASQRVLEKVGMSFVERAHYFGMDCYRYSIERLKYRPDA
jgi:ribosomal-protein-alanine N-acetyltransferase